MEKSTMSRDSTYSSAVFTKNHDQNFRRVPKQVALKSS